MKGKVLSYEEKRNLQKAEARKEAERITPQLSRDPDWGLAIGGVKNTSEAYSRFNRSITRITKKAIKLLYPQYTCSVRRGSGTAYSWVTANLIIPELEPAKVRETNRRYEYKDISQRIEDILVALDIRFATYMPDWGPQSEKQRCLHVEINGAL